MYKPLNWIPSRPSSPTLFEYVWFHNVVADPGTLSVAFTVKLTVLTLVFYVVTGTPVPVTNWPGKIAVLAAANSICNALKAALFYCSCYSLVAPLIAKGPLLVMLLPLIKSADNANVPKVVPGTAAGTLLVWFNVN